MTGHEYSDLIAKYIKHNYSDRNINIYREVNLGRTIIGKNRRIDIFIVDNTSNKAFAIECKIQTSQGTADEKIPYAIDDLVGSSLKGCICYAGDGFSKGVLHLLESFPFAAYCLPDEDLLRSDSTKDLDHLIAINFSWWDVIVDIKKLF